MARLTGKVTVITGGAGGIGRTAARVFTEEGAQVLLVDLNEAALEQAVQAAGSAQASYVVADATQPAPVQQAIHTAVERYGGVDIFLHTHLYGPPPPDWISSPETWGMIADPSGHSVEECPVYNPDH